MNEKENKPVETAREKPRNVIEMKFDLAREAAIKSPLISPSDLASSNNNVVQIKFSSNYLFLTGVAVMFAEFMPFHAFYPYWNIETVCVSLSSKKQVDINLLRTAERNGMKRCNEIAINGLGRIAFKQLNNTRKGLGFFVPFSNEDLKLLSEEHQALVR